MRSSDEGFLAMADAMLFIVVILVAAALLVEAGIDEAEDETDASQALDAMMSSRVRLSDLSEGDDSILGFPDLLAMSALKGSEGIREYAADVLDVCLGEGMYSLDVLYEDRDGTEHPMHIGSGTGPCAASYERKVAVSTGGDVTLSLSIHRP